MVDARVAHEAAHWWAEVLRDPKSSEAGQPSENQLKEFVTELALRIQLEQSDRVHIMCDYEPVGLLRRAAEHALLPAELFPTKYRMSVMSDHVVAKQGYSASWDIVYSVPGWVRPACNAPDIDDDRILARLCGKPKYHQSDCGFWKEPL